MPPDSFEAPTGKTVASGICYKSWGASLRPRGCRTLRRRLADENTTLREILDATRKQVALVHLRDPNYTLSDVALLAGFSDQSAFVRAFRRWTSTTLTV